MKKDYNEPWDDDCRPLNGKGTSAIIITIGFFIILLVSFLMLAAFGIKHLVMCQ